MGKKLTKNLFKEKANIKHRHRYNYDMVEYTNTKTKVPIKCRDHGIFWQTPRSHLFGSGCPECYHEGNKLTTDIFKERSGVIHNHFYIYDKVVYVGANQKIIIICPIHGDFEQRAYDHMNGHGCIKCRSDNNTMNIDVFKERSSIIHNHFYIYDKVVYINNRKKVIITCPIHGDFEQMPGSHLNSNGCPKCQKKTSDIIYLQQNLTIEEEPIEIDGIIQCRCSYCKEYFTPTNRQLSHRIYSLLGKTQGECRLYCSDGCKQLCPIFYQISYPKGDKPYRDTSRPDQPELRQLTLKRDNNQCQRCGSSKDLICHHYTGVEVNPTESADVDNCITLCRVCHDRLHSSGQCDTRRQPCVMV